MASNLVYPPYCMRCEHSESVHGNVVCNQCRGSDRQHIFHRAPPSLPDGEEFRVKFFCIMAGIGVSILLMIAMVVWLM